MHKFIAHVRYRRLAKHWAMAHLTARNPHGRVVKVDWKAFLDVVKRYSAKGRYYHGVSHLINGLDFLNRYSDPDVHLAKIAFFFHDAVMVTGNRGDSERASEALLVTYTTKQFFKLHHIRWMRKLILGTIDHQNFKITDRDFPMQLWNMMNDADLSIFGTDRKTYLKYAKNVFKEYSQYTVEQYKAGRTKFLEDFKTQPIFRSWQCKHLNDVAYANINAELLLLKSDKFLGRA